LDIAEPKKETPSLSLSGLEESFRDSLRREPGSKDQSFPPDLPNAAVCAILKEGTTDSGPELLLVKRRISEGDPWSGQMALPGGRSRGAESPAETVIREVMEETRISLRLSEVVGPLDQVLPGNGSLRVFPFVSFKHEPVLVVIDGVEIVEHYWIPLSYFMNIKNSSTYEFEREGKSFKVPAFAYLEKNVIWGMTLRIIRDLVSRIGGGKNSR
jgi:8-oxo-dGTP pyrophosphatase MutT (NUDIX family)